ncbi:MAG TPA: dihydropteroate synthase [Gammaproteobacteria bacterium]
MLDLTRPRVMGILNVTPDSFSDGGRFDDPGRAAEHAARMVDEGAALIDVGGESTRPGATPVPLEEELRRVLPVVSRLARELPVPLSVDTSQPAVMRAAVGAGASLVNDVRALSRPGALATAVELGVPVCLMHMQGEPASMQAAPSYPGGVLAAVRAFLAARVAECRAAGLAPGQLLLDPGFGFGKTLEHNLALLDGLGALAELGPPLLVGLSRKSMLAAILGPRRATAEARLHAGVAAAVVAVRHGARVVRTHDVAATVAALALCAALEDDNAGVADDGT